MRISHVILACITHAHNLVSLTLHGMLDQPAAATAIFDADHILLTTSKCTMHSETHVFLPHLEAFRFALVGHDDDDVLFIAVIQFLCTRPHLRLARSGYLPMGAHAQTPT